MGIKEVNYYRVLGVRTDATEQDIKKRYRTLSKKHHPDANGSDGGRMALINEAYAVLSNPLRRKDYLPPNSSQPIRHNHTYQTHATSATKTHKNTTNQKEEDAKNESWSFLWWYVLAIPVALVIVNYGETIYKAIFS